jgi:hypothetical protein
MYTSTYRVRNRSSSPDISIMAKEFQTEASECNLFYTSLLLLGPFLYLKEENQEFHDKL